MSTASVMSTIKLREIEASDLPILNKWRNDASIIDYLGSNFFFIAEEIDQRWYENYIAHRDQAVRLAIVDAENEEYVGNVNLTSIHKINRNAEFSIMIGNKAYWGKGIGEDATRQMIQHGFMDLNLERIYLYVLEQNDRAIKLYEKVGFKREGLQRNCVYKNGTFQSMWCMAIIKEEFQAQ